MWVLPIEVLIIDSPLLPGNGSIISAYHTIQYRYLFHMHSLPFLITCLLQLVFPPVMAPVLSWRPLLSLVLLLFMYSYCCYFFSGFFSMPRVSAFNAFPSAVEVPSATDVSNIPGVPTVAGFTAVIGVSAVVGVLLLLAFFHAVAGVPACECFCCDWGSCYCCPLSQL